ncbi:DUF202 domain-containing protein [Actinokineospora auranticolor]|uniref:Putative membrane protein n=1 Tax=Actinokineospora auranticolor TaxID=155976 RepID=A0A2S6GUL6_9PSEU|nr:DUF202 domain-containing protein [Actinokineospora auranticolor]PPK68886.1 putative membrane protein [Actinokineospora auranticolor]
MAEPEGEEPDYRFTLANERTFLAWVRTALALVAGGVAVWQYLPDLGVPALRGGIGIALVVLGTVLAGLSHHRWRATQRAIRRSEPLPTGIGVPLLAAGVTAVALGVLVLVVVGR